MTVSAVLSCGWSFSEAVTPHAKHRMIQWDKVSPGSPDAVSILYWDSAAVIRLWSLSHCLLQVCAVSQWATVWSHEDERLTPVPAFRHPAWRPQL